MANLKRGSSGTEVKKLQEALINKGYGDIIGKADGVLGPKTEKAIIEYQKKNGLTVDGIAGKNTLGTLYSSNDKTGNSTLSAAAAGAVNAGKLAAGGTKPSTPSASGSGNTGKGTGTTNTPPTNTGTADAKQTFTYDPFTYDKEFTYDDFSYGDFSYGDYAESEIVTQAMNLLNQHNAGKPGAYQSVWQDEADAYLSKYQNRDPFSYDINSDALYQQYKDQYIQQGQMAMMDTMGQAAAMTGGYGNSYAQSVGQQAYNQQLSQLNEIMPELYGMAYNRYNQEGQDLLNQYNIYMDKENMEYGRYQDNLNKWYQDLDYLTGRYDSERNFDYNQWSSNRSLAYDQWSSDRSLAYDAYATDKNLAYDAYTNDMNLAYEDYLTGRSEAFSDYQTQQNQAFTSSENQKSRDFTETENQKDRDTKVTTTETKEPKYTVLNYEEQKKWEKDFEKAGSLNDVDRIADRMEQAGVDPQVVASWRDSYAKKFEDEKPPEKPDLTGKVPIKASGGGGGRWYMTTK